MKVAKTPEPQKPESVPDLPAGLLGLEIPQDIRNVLKVLSFFSNTVVVHFRWTNDPSTFSHSHLHFELTAICIFPFVCKNQYL